MSQFRWALRCAGIPIAFCMALPVIAPFTNAANIPHGQSREPGPALSAEQAMAAMKLPEGFSVECVAQEPTVVNPTSFTFDDRGRIWVTESTEYPRKDSGPGHDRVKILEDVNHTGKYDKVTIFKEGLNIPCGIAMGNGGVYVTNSPDVLFLQDTDGDGVADKQTVILTGFGRDDRHELPNSLTWGPDGWLYGMNGVFNRAVVKFDGQTYDFTCALWRYHPLRKKFELYAQGTSNPWGLDYNRQGDWFVSCCVIDHLFELTQSGYYQRQGGPYPPMTRAIPSITTERHQAAAYAGLCIYDADVFPQEYRDTLIMGNLHGSCINRDTLTRDGASYVQHNADDFLSANDAWFMPVSEKVGPDGCLYVMDWYDKYHCYQDAGRDPAGIDRTRGRIYRISYNHAPLAKPFDLQKLRSDELIALLGNSNVWWRRAAQRILHEKYEPALTPRLQKMALDESDTTPAHMHALWLLISQGALDPAFHRQVLVSKDAPTRNWGARAAGEMQSVSPEVYENLKRLASDADPDVRLQLIVAAGRMTSPDPLPLLLASLDNPANAKDKLISAILYNNLCLVGQHRDADVLAALEHDATAQQNFGSTVVRWARDAINVQGHNPAFIVADLRKNLVNRGASEGMVHDWLQSTYNAIVVIGTKPGERAALFDAPLRAQIEQLGQSQGEAGVTATLIALWWDAPPAQERARRFLADQKLNAATRADFLTALSQHPSAENIPSFAAFAQDAGAPMLLRQAALDALGAMDDRDAAGAIVAALPDMRVDLKPMAINALVRSKASASVLLDAVADKRVSVAQMNENHARRILTMGDAELSKRLASVWGVVRSDRDPERMKVVEAMKKMVNAHPPGDARAGWKVFEAHCMQCHTIYGKGGDIGPDLTGVGRDNLDAILSNVLDPNLVVGAPYLQYVARLKNGTSVTGLVAENTPERVVLRDGTQRTAITREELKDLRATTLSMMPEGLEKTMSEPEFIDLVAFLLTREPPKSLMAPCAAVPTSSPLQVEAERLVQ